MKKLLLILLCVPLIGFGQLTMIPDANFEQELINLGYDTGTPNGSVPTANIDTVTGLELGNLNISDLTGIEDFTDLIYLVCEENNLITLDLSNNPNLESLHCSFNKLSCLNLKSGGNQNIWEITADLQNYGYGYGYGYGLSCVEVDDLAYSNNNWISNYDFSFDNGVIFSENCNNACSNTSTLVLDIGHKNKTLIKITDVLGRETKSRKNEPIFYIYNDGTVEKRIIIE